MSSLIPFQFESHEIRTIVENGDVWVVARDVAEALGYKWDSHLLDKIPTEWKGTKPFRTPGGTQQLSILSEQGLYFFLGRSDKPKALPLQMWVAGEVLPSIRKTGSYNLADHQLPSLAPVNREFRAALNLAKSIGFKGNQAVLSANKAIRKRMAIDCLELLEATHLIADQQDVLLTVTEIGQRLGLPTRQVNPMLETLGLQKGYRDHKNRQQWEITEEGSRYGVYQDTGKKHSDGTPVRQIRWNGALVSDLQKSLTVPLVEARKTH